MTRHADNPHIQSFKDNLKDFNGTGSWSVEGVQERYQRYCEILKIAEPRVPEALEHRNGEVVWIYSVMESVIEGIEKSDAACVALGVDFIEEDDLFAFGKTLKSNTARALRRAHAHLTETQKERIRKRVVTMLISGIIPHEMREYAKLLRTVGVGEYRQKLEENIPRDNPFAMRFYKILCPLDDLPSD
jgi:hypothetical protein